MKNVPETFHLKRSSPSQGTIIASRMHLSWKAVASYGFIKGYAHVPLECNGDDEYRKQIRSLARFSHRAIPLPTLLRF